MISGIKTVFAIAYAVTLAGGGAYLGWHANSIYTQVTTNPLEFALKTAGMGGK